MAAGGGTMGGTSGGGSAGGVGSNGGLGGTDTGGAGAVAGSGGAGAVGAAGTGGGSLSGCAEYAANAVAFAGHCYAARATPSTWSAAHDDCETDGGYLVAISSENRSEAEFLAENAFVWALGGSREQWIGATDGLDPDEPGNGTFYGWDNGEPMTENHWSPGQPNNSRATCQDGIPCSCGNSCWEHCAFQWGTDGAWNDRVCEHLLPYVCEWVVLPP